MLAKIKLLALCCFALVFGAVLFFASNSQNQAKAGNCGNGADNYFHWENNYHIYCSGDYYFDPRLTSTVQTGWRIFVRDDGKVMVVDGSGNAVYRDLNSIPKAGEQISFTCGGTLTNVECIQQDSSTVGNATKEEGN